MVFKDFLDFLPSEFGEKFEFKTCACFFQKGWGKKRQLYNIGDVFSKFQTNPDVVSCTAVDQYYI